MVTCGQGVSSCLDSDCLEVEEEFSYALICYVLKVKKALGQLQELKLLIRYAERFHVS